PLPLFELEPDLFRQGVEQRESAVGIRRRGHARGAVSTTPRRLTLKAADAGEAQHEVIGPGQSRLVDHGQFYVAARDIWQILGKLRQRHVLHGDEAVEDRILIARIRRSRRGTADDIGAVGWIGRLKFRLVGYKRKGTYRAILHMHLEVEALL